MDDLRDLFFTELIQKFKSDDDFIILTADMDLFSIQEFKKEFPHRFIDVGVSEQNLINVSAGLSKMGKKVVIFGILSFLVARCFEQIKLNICGMNLPVVIVGIGTGVSFSYDGTTHHATQDIGIMRTLPELTIYNPSDAISINLVVEEVSKFKNPNLVRLDKGLSINQQKKILVLGALIVRKPLTKVNVIYCGTVFKIALGIINEAKKIGVEIGLVENYRITPISVEMIKFLDKSEKVIVVEENTQSGGLFSLLAQVAAHKLIKVDLFSFSFPDVSILKYGSRDWLQQKYFPKIEKVMDFIQFRR